MRRTPCFPTNTLFRGDYIFQNLHDLFRFYRPAHGTGIDFLERMDNVFIMQRNIGVPGEFLFHQ